MTRPTLLDLGARLLLMAFVILVMVGLDAPPWASFGVGYVVFLTVARR